jgi:hypothetical protein
MAKPARAIAAANVGVRMLFSLSLGENCRLRASCLDNAVLPSFVPQCAGRVSHRYCAGNKRVGFGIAGKSVWTLQVVSAGASGTEGRNVQTLLITVAAGNHHYIYSQQLTKELAAALRLASHPNRGAKLYS